MGRIYVQWFTPTGCWQLTMNNGNGDGAPKEEKQEKEDDADQGEDPADEFIYKVCRLVGYVCDKFIEKP